ncbi:hypothetical protein [uncultured Nostoc sp.]|uniref:hypothetical protein n=1 Tax=uncultured Nostoc sp. TaxID=340711 RepID=UPI0035CBAAD4
MENLIQAIKYPVPSDMKECFEKLVKRPYNNHIKTDAWQTEILNTTAEYHRKSILEQGTADFSVSFNELNPVAKVLLYCYQYMQMHVMSSYHIFCKHWDLFNGYVSSDSDPYFYNPSPLFIDFGCGPLSSGLAFAHAYMQFIGCKNRIAFHYIGIDRAKPMLKKAKEFSLGRHFSKDSTFDFLESYNDLVGMISKYISQQPDILIILNFSYFFASTSLNVQDLVAIVRTILMHYKSNQVYVVFQNPQVETKNIKWHQFRSSLPQFESVINGSLKEEIFYEYTMNDYNDYKPVQLYYDLLRIK